MQNLDGYAYKHCGEIFFTQKGCDLFAQKSENVQAKKNREDILVALKKNFDALRATMIVPQAAPVSIKPRPAHPILPSGGYGDGFCIADDSIDNVVGECVGRDLTQQQQPKKDQRKL